MAAAQYFEQVQKIFIAFYQRPADPAGLKYWAERVDAAGGDINQVINAFASSAEATALYGAVNATTIGTVVDSLYMALFNVAPDAAGKAFYVDGFAAGTFTAGTIALAVLNGAQNGDAATIANKLVLANDFTKQVDGRPLTDVAFGTGSFAVTYAGDTDAQNARDILKTVTVNPLTILTSAQLAEQIKAKIADAGDPINVGGTISLTALSETKVLTAGNDTVDGATVVNSADGDNIVDSSTTDSDVANIILTKATTTAPVFANVEKINLALNYFDPTFDASKVSNGTIVVSTAQEGNNKATFTGVGTNGVKFEVGSGITALTLNGTSSAADSTSVKLAGGNSTLSVGAATLIETVALNSAGSAANVVTLTNSASAETFSVTGSQDLTLKATAANLAGDTLTKALDTGKTVAVQLTALAATSDMKAVAADTFSTTATASALGANTLTFAAGTTSLTINGADQLDNAASVLAATGTGTTDVLNLTLAADQANIDTSSYETVNVNYTGSTVDLSLAALKGGVATSAVSKYVLTSARNVTLTTATAKSIDFSGLTGTATATLSGVGNTTSGISVTGSANADTITLTGLTTGKGTVVAGAGNDTITGGTGDDSITAGAGNDSIAASTGNDSVDGGDGNDIINTGAGNNFVLGGAGDDSILLTTGVDAVVAGAGNDTVTVAGANLTTADTLVGGDGTDTLSITTSLLAATTALDNVSGFETITFAALGAQAVTTVDSLIASGATLTVNFATPTGAVTWNGAAETDGALKLTVAASNFAHVVTGGAGADTITIGAATTAVSVVGGAGADTISVTGGAAHVVKGGAGADTIDMGTSVAGVIQLATITDSTTGSYDSISNYTSASEKIDLAAITNFATTVASNVTATVSVGGIAAGLYTASTSGAFTSLADAVTRVGADVKTAGSAVVFNYGSDAYVFVDTDGAANTSNDILVKLVGVTAASIADTASVLTVS